MKGEYYITLLCFGDKKHVKELKSFLDECISDISSKKNNDFLPPIDPDIEGEITSQIDTGSQIDVLSIEFPCLLMGGFYDGFKKITKKFKNIAFICAGKFVDPISMFCDVYFAAYKGKMLAEGSYCFESGDYEDNEEDVDPPEKAEEEVLNYFCEGLADFIMDNDLDDLELFSEKLLCKHLVILSQKFVSDSPYFIDAFVNVFPKTFWLDPTCTSLMPLDYNFDIEALEKDLLEDEAVCIALAKISRAVLAAMPEEMQKKVMQALDAADSP